MDTSFTPFMRDLEARFKRAASLEDRANYKIFYCQVRPAPILTLGINPGGAPSNTNPDGRTHKDGAIAAASASFYENNEHDILDCDWRENSSLRSLLAPLLDGGESAIRGNVVKTNMAFHRSAMKKDIDIGAAMDQAAPFLTEIINVVRPIKILLTGVALAEFTNRFAARSTVLVAPERDPDVKQIVFAAASATLRQGGAEVLVVQLAHASQFGWTYARYNVAKRIAALEACPGVAHVSQTLA
jgi:hypothetical protein